VSFTLVTVGRFHFIEAVISESWEITDLRLSQWFIVGVEPALWYLHCVQVFRVVEVSEERGQLSHHPRDSQCWGGGLCSQDMTAKVRVWASMTYYKDSFTFLPFLPLTNKDPSTTSYTT
jgi:hypothetical protein